MLAPHFGRPPVPPPPPAPLAGYTPPSPGTWLCAKCQLCATTIPARLLSSESKHLITALCQRLLDKPHNIYVAIAPKFAIFFSKKRTPPHAAYAQHSRDQRKDVPWNVSCAAYAQHSRDQRAVSPTAIGTPNVKTFRGTSLVRRMRSIAAPTCRIATGDRPPTLRRSVERLLCGVCAA